MHIYTGRAWPEHGSTERPGGKWGLGVRSLGKVRCPVQPVGAVFVFRLPLVRQSWLCAVPLVRTFFLFFNSTVPGVILSDTAGEYTTWGSGGADPVASLACEGSMYRHRFCSVLVSL